MHRIWGRRKRECVESERGVFGFKFLKLFIIRIRLCEVRLFIHITKQTGKIAII